MSLTNDEMHTWIEIDTIHYRFIFVTCQFCFVYGYDVIVVLEPFYTLLSGIYSQSCEINSFLEKGLNSGNEYLRPI